MLTRTFRLLLVGFRSLLHYGFLESVMRGIKRAPRAWSSLPQIPFFRYFHCIPTYLSLPRTKMPSSVIPVVHNHTHREDIDEALAVDALLFSVNNHQKLVDPQQQQEQQEHVPGTPVPSVYASPLSKADQWQTTIENVVNAIVEIRYCRVAPFDTAGIDLESGIASTNLILGWHAGAMTSSATGFVVDAKLGIILTNRHVVSSGPFVGVAICHDQEEVDVFPIYRDPIHDFGFLRFDPKKIRYMQLTEIRLRPDLAQVGLDIRVLGNDAGEKLSILAGSLSRLDRNTPYYGQLTYNDFNTFYLQAASNSSGGSSGSPVINIDGFAVGLQAGGYNSGPSTNFYLPLDRILYALEYVRKGDPVPRGDIQTQFLYRPFDEVRRLGLNQVTEDSVRQTFPDELGMLVVATVLPDGPAYGKLQEGDVLLTVNGNYITKFVPLEAIFDSHIDKDIEIAVDRGGKDICYTIRVGDLHAITPDRFVEVGGSTLNEVSYQLARTHAVSCRGVYVSGPSGMFILNGPGHGWIIKSIDDQETPDLDAFIAVIRTIPDRARIPVVFYSITDTHTILMSVVQMERHWTPFRLATRNDMTGYWDFIDLGDPVPPRTIKIPKMLSFVDMTTTNNGPPILLNRSIVAVSYYTPYLLEGYPFKRRSGTGLILDKERGLVVVARSAVPNAMGDVNLTVADTLVIPAKVVYLHPTHNFTIVKYDATLLRDTPVMSASISKKTLQRGDPVNLLSYYYSDNPSYLTTTVVDIYTVNIPSCHSCLQIPRFRGINHDAIALESPLAACSFSGILTSPEDHSVQGLWLSYLGDSASGYENEYRNGLHISQVLPALRKLQQQKPGDRPIGIRSLDVEYTSVALHQAFAMGLSEEWIRKIQQASPTRHKVLQVHRVPVGHHTSELKEQDLILSMNGKVVAHVYDMDMEEDDEESSSFEEVELRILRQKQEHTIRVKTTVLSGLGTDRMVIWAGAVLQAPHKAVLQQSKILPSHIYITDVIYGSPAHMYGASETCWITHINSEAVNTLDDFIQAIRDSSDTPYVRVRCVSFDNIPSVISIKMVNHYFPLVDMAMDEEGNWVNHKIQ
ncbi:trypsin-like cysteine/serine peptidase domain-containing protein [Dichotomocladium elegans]|nr:trypsin-like cysteine/serine peptidase domain-containing protein [Dichotomocladium elegans]